nr:MAG TPA: hypothetical protein [Caudoviricetes sp.]
MIVVIIEYDILYHTFYLTLVRFIGLFQGECL